MIDVSRLMTADILKACFKNGFDLHVLALVHFARMADGLLGLATKNDIWLRRKPKSRTPGRTRSWADKYRRAGDDEGC